MYSEKVMDHFEHPRNVGEIENASGVGTVGNAKCGDIMRIYLDIDEEGIIRDVKFKTFGCGAAVATSSMATELVKGKSIQEAMEVTNKDVYKRQARDSAVIRVSQEALQKELSEGELSDIIGVNMVLEIPAHVARKNNIDRNTDVFGLLYASDAYDKYLTITAVFRR